MSLIICWTWLAKSPRTPCNSSRSIACSPKVADGVGAGGSAVAATSDEPSPGAEAGRSAHKTSAAAEADGAWAKLGAVAAARSELPIPGSNSLCMNISSAAVGAIASPPGLLPPGFVHVMPLRSGVPARLYRVTSAS